MAFLLSWYQVAGCGPEHMTEERDHFPERERERGRSIQEREEKLRES